MIRLTSIITVLTVQLILTSCTGQGIIYDDKRVDSSDNEQNCLKQPTSNCLLSSASAITRTMSDEVAQSETLNILAKAYFELGNQPASIAKINEISVKPMQFGAVFELTYLAKKEGRATDDFIELAQTLTTELELPTDKLVAQLLNAILLFENQQPQIAQQHLQQAMVLAISLSNKRKILLDLRILKKLLPKLIQFGAFKTIEQLISLEKMPHQRIAAKVEYLVQLKESDKTPSSSDIEALLTQWYRLKGSHKRYSEQSVVKLLVQFNKLDQAEDIRIKQKKIIIKATSSAVIIQQLALTGNIDAAKKELVSLLKIISQRNKLKKPPVVYTQTDFTLDNLRAQAIADIALALADKNQMKKAVHYAGLINTKMGHIQGYTLTKLALKYARGGDINSALLTVKSIHRPVNRAACLAQISSELAKKGNLKRAISIANRVDRQSWRDIANSEISIAQAKQNDINTAMKTLDGIQRSYSAVYAMTEIARTLQVTQNKR